VTELFTEEGLLGGECGDCGRRHFPLAEWCPWCGGEGPTQVQLSTGGVLWSWTTVLHPPPGYSGEVPYGFGVVELPADGLRIVTRLTETDPARLSAGQPMRFVVDPAAESWAFEPR
jgi:uncharacterized protein